MGTENDVLGPRILALVIDWIIILTTAIGVPYGVYEVGRTLGGDGVGMLLGAVPALLAIPFPFVYFVYLEGSRGQTLGKQLVNIVVVTEDGEHIGYGEAVIRTLLRMIDAMGIVFPYLVGLLLIATSDHGQRLGDRLAETVVVRTE